MSIRLAESGPTQPNRQHPKLSIVMPVHNALNYLKPCLESLQKWTAKEAFELILVDDASDAETADYVLSQSEWATVIRFDKNRGFSAACNAGADAVRHDWIFFANSDLEFRAGWLEGLWKPYHDGESFAALGCKLLYPDGTIQHAGVITYEDPLNDIPFGMTGVFVGAARSDPDANQLLAYDVVTAAALLVDREAFIAAGKFDDDYFNGGEDVDLCLSLRVNGGRILYNPHCELIHHESKSGPERWQMTLQNQQRVAQKWAGKVRPNAIVDEAFQYVPYPALRNPEPLPSRPQFSVIMIADNDLATIAKSVESVRKNLGLFNELVIVDNASSDGTWEYLKLFEGVDPRVKLMRLPAAAALGRCLNEGVSLSNGSELCIVSADVLVGPSWLYRLQRSMSHSGIGACGPVFDQVLTEQSLQFHMPPNLPSNISAPELSHIMSVQWNRHLLTVPTLSLRCMMVKRNAVEAVGGFDNGAPWDSSGLDISTRLSQAGYHLGLAKDVFVHCIPTVSPVAEIETMKTARETINAEWLAERHSLASLSSRDIGARWGLLGNQIASRTPIAA